MFSGSFFLAMALPLQSMSGYHCQQSRPWVKGECKSMNEDYKMSPLARILVGILHKGSWAAAALIICFAGILLYQRWTPDGFVFQKGDFGFLGVLAALLILAVYLVRGMRKEMDNPGGG
jgi:uncharacterized sodium:solute symporter family permease YidK